MVLYKTAKSLIIPLITIINSCIVDRAFLKVIRMLNVPIHKKEPELLWNLRTYICIASMF